MLTGQTSSGFKAQIKEEVINDWEILEIIDELEDKPNLMVRLAKKLLGDEQYTALKRHCTKDGRVLLDMMEREITELMSNTESTKNL